MTNFQETVKKYRAQRKMNLSDFGSSLGVTHVTIRNWQKGLTTPSKCFLLALAMRHGDWRRDFALDCIEAIDPDYFETPEMQKAIA